MLQAIAQNWWMLLVRGICAIAFGVMAFAWPGMTLLVLVIMYGAYSLVDGVTAVILGIKSRHSNESWGAMVLVGMLGVLVGLIAFARPGIAETALLFFVAAAAVARGVFEIVAAIRLRKVIDNEWLLVLAGASSILFGVLVLVWPAAGLTTIVWLIGAAAVAIGVLCTALSLRLRSLNERLRQNHPPTMAPAG